MVNKQTGDSAFFTGMLRCLLRDYFAAKAMTGCLPGDGINADDRARWAYRMADAMLKAREA